MTSEREAEVARLVAAVRRRAAVMPAVAGVGLCGSWAAGRPTMASDVDLVVLTADRPALVQDRVWADGSVGPRARLLLRRDWGPWVTELRYRSASGLEVDVAVAELAWASIAPLDAGTARVVGGGFVVVHDRAGLLGALVAAVRASRAP